MFTIDFKNKLAFVSGGGRGIGLAITEALAAGTFTSESGVPR